MIKIGIPEGLLKLRKHISNFFGRTTTSKRRGILITSGFFAILTLFLLFMCRTEYVPVFTIENPKDAQAVQKILDDKKIRYKPGEGGKTILVDSKDRNAAELALATSTSFSSSTTLEETWNNMNMASSDSHKKMIWKNFKKCEVIGEIKKLEFIADADADIAFANEKEGNKETCAVIRIKSKNEINQDEKNRILNSVCSKLEIQPKNIVLVDGKFNVIK